MLLRGKGAGRDVEGAIKMWALAADQGDAYAQFNLAQMYLTGTGVNRDPVKAYSLLALAGKTLDVSKQLRELSSQISSEEMATVQ